MTPSSNQVYPRIRMLLPSLTKSERQIARFFLDQDSMSEKTTIGTIAKKLSVSNALIVKVAQKIGYSGFKELKNEIVAFQHDGSYRISKDIHVDDNCEKIVQKVLNNAINSLNELLSFACVKDIESAAKAIASSRRLSIFAVGGTSVIADDFYHKLLRIGYVSHVPKDHHYMMISASVMNESDTAIVITQSGNTIDLMDAVKVAKEAGATIVNVTNNYNEQLFEMTDYAIYAPASSEALFGRSGSARLVQLSLIDCLFATIANMLPKQSTENIDKVSRITKHLHLPL